MPTPLIYGVRKCLWRQLEFAPSQVQAIGADENAGMQTIDKLRAALLSFDNADACQYLEMMGGCASGQSNPCGNLGDV